MTDSRDRCESRVAVALVISWLGAAARAGAEGRPAAKKPQPDNYDEVFARYLEKRAASRRRPRRPGRLDEQPDDGPARPSRQRPRHRPGRREHHGVGHGRLERVEGPAAPRRAAEPLRPREEAAGGDRSDEPGRARRATTSSRARAATTRAGVLTAVMTARVAEVLPNGDLVVEGVREIDINGDRQIVVLTGVGARRRRPAGQLGAVDLARAAAAFATSATD